MKNAMLIRHRCFDCGYIHEELISPKALCVLLKNGKLRRGLARFPTCPDCKELVQLFSFEEVKYRKGASHGNKKS